MYTNSRRRLHAAFVDYEKAFDTVNRSKLWKKLLNHGINGDILATVKDLYAKTKACVRVNGKLSDYFNCNIGVRQGDNLSPLLFSIFLNDLENSLRKEYNGLEFAYESIRERLSDDDVEIFLRIYLLLYADDAIILAETDIDLQNAINCLEEYCKEWDLRANARKTKIMIFSRGKVRKTRVISIGAKELERVDEFTYLGVVFRYNGSFQATIRNNIEKARKAFFRLKQLNRTLCLRAPVMLTLLEKVIEPILLYGSEIWGYDKLDSLEVFHRHCIRQIIGTSKNSPCCMVYGESGIEPIKYKVWQRMVAYWHTTQKQS